MVNTSPPRARPYENPPAEPLPEDDAARKLPGPRYDLTAIQRLFDSPRIVLITPRCQQTVLVRGWTVEDVADVISYLKPQHYHDSEWCSTSVGMVIDCDSYVIRVDGRTLVPSATGIETYIKFGCTQSASRLLVVSCH
jgi:hypothetical protein